MRILTHSFHFKCRSLLYVFIHIQVSERGVMVNLVSNRPQYCFRPKPRSKKAISKMGFVCMFLCVYKRYVCIFRRSCVISQTKSSKTVCLSFFHHLSLTYIHTQAPTPTFRSNQAYQKSYRSKYLSAISNSNTYLFTHSFIQTPNEALKLKKI